VGHLFPCDNCVPFWGTFVVVVCIATCTHLGIGVPTAFTKEELLLMEREMRSQWPLLSELEGRDGHYQVRSLASSGGNAGIITSFLCKDSEVRTYVLNPVVATHLCKGILKGEASSQKTENAVADGGKWKAETKPAALTREKIKEMERDLQLHRPVQPGMSLFFRAPQIVSGAYKRMPSGVLVGFRSANNQIATLEMNFVVAWTFARDILSAAVISTWTDGNGNWASPPSARLSG
jgi:hypothetical protein